MLLVSRVVNSTQQINLETIWNANLMQQGNFISVFLARLKIKNIKNYNFACRFVWVWDLVADIEGGTEAEGVCEYGVEENIWT